MSLVPSGSSGFSFGTGNVGAGIANIGGVVQDLFAKVKTIQFRYLDANQAWQNNWPPASIPLTEGYAIRPVAVEITVEFTDWGKIRRLIEVAG